MIYLLKLHNETMNSFKPFIISMLLNEYNISKVVNPSNIDSVKHETNDNTYMRHINLFSILLSSQ
ncbi:hypothetical protein PIROE2DRAFT_5220 [Piromyces sp. E2]|nr:hypothetical protein PIROE2DRAFT_5220 [Piromyces sp. E2]|eukprot:OUM67359.1 hypothetical protein PIROE2DRAFT_5220 [Piromyces sp. E2]